MDEIEKAREVGETLAEEIEEARGLGRELEQRQDRRKETLGPTSG